MAGFKLESNPLFNAPAAPSVQAEPPVQEEPEETRATFIIRKDLLQRLKNLAFTERKTLKDMLNEILARELDRIEAEYATDGRSILSAPKATASRGRKRKSK